jgi:hypothetical protein
MKTEGEFARVVLRAGAIECPRSSVGRGDGRRKLVDALSQSGDRRTLVLLAQYRVALAGPARYGSAGDRALDGDPQRRQALPFLTSMGLFLLAYAGLAISLWPNVVPPEVTLWEAASPPATQIFLLYGVAILNSGHPRLHRVFLLRLPRQGPPRRGVSSALRSDCVHWPCSLARYRYSHRFRKAIQTGKKKWGTRISPRMNTGWEIASRASRLQTRP